MPYYYTDPTQESKPRALPDVEVFVRSFEDCDTDQHLTHNVDEPCPYGLGAGFYYAFGSPGCMWDSDPVGPFDTEEEALESARERRDP